MVGKTIAHCCMIEKLGEGGMGMVCKARDSHVDRFAGVRYITQEGGVDFIVMEHVAGKPLDDLISRKGMRLNEALKHSVEITDDLNKAHSAGIIHRDLKPSNANGRVKVLDFGAATMDVGRRASRGNSKAATLAVIIREEPPPLPAEAPRDLKHVITRCSRKELDRRSQHTATSPVRSRTETVTGASTASEARIYENISATHRRQPCY